MPINAYHTVLLSRVGEMYVCGSNKLGQLGTGTTKTQRTLKRVESPQLNYVCTGQTHTVGVAYDGTVWGCGKNSLGQLGYLSRNHCTTTMTQICDLSDINSVAVGSDSTILLGNDGQIRVMGVVNTQNVKTHIWAGIPEVVPISVKIKQISAGTTHYLALDVQGCVHSCGDGKSGALGHGDFESRMYPEKIPTLSDIMSISSGASHNLCLDVSGVVYGFGYNCSYQLGVGHHDELVETPLRIISEIIRIVCGGNFSIFCDSSQQIWVCGSNTGKQLESTGPQYIRSPELCKQFNNMEIIPGYWHIFAISTEGEIYSCGKNASYQCGLPRNRFKNSATGFSLVPDINFRTAHKIKSANSAFVMN